MEELNKDVPLEKDGKHNPCKHPYAYLIPISDNSSTRLSKEAGSVTNLDSIVTHYICTRCKSKLDKNTFLEIELKFQGKKPKTTIGESTYPYTVTEKVIKQRSIANLKHGKSSKLIKQLINCGNCPAREVCDAVDGMTEEEKEIGCIDLRQSYIRIIKADPHNMFYKTFAELKYRTDLQNLKDGKEGLPLSKESLKAFELLLKATKIQSDIELRKLETAKKINHKGKTFDDEVIYELD